MSGMKQRVCRECGNHFESETRTKYCTDDCAKKAQLKQMAVSYAKKHNPKKKRKKTIYKKICLECGNEFPATNNRQNYCNDKCLKAHKSKLDVVRYEIAKTIPKPQKHKSQIDKIAKEADEMGLTYGQLQAQKYLATIRF